MRVEIDTAGCIWFLAEQRSEKTFIICKKENMTPNGDISYRNWKPKSGIMREANFDSRTGKFIDVVYMDMLREEWCMKEE